MDGIAIKKILAPVDLSENSEYALKYAKLLSEQFKAKLYIYHCITDIQSTIGYVPSLPASQIINTIKEDVLREIEHFRNRYDLNDNVEVVIEVGNAPRKIVEFADKNNIDLIVMGAHGKSGLERFMFGSVTEKVMRLSSKPVLEIKLSS
jgi:nucleotide-binding universal stress UspA family protein